MTYLILFLLAIAVIASHIILYRMIVKMAKYQNFKSNVLIRLALSDDFKVLKTVSEEKHEIDDADYLRIGCEHEKQIIDKIKEKINTAIDEELDNDSSWEDALTAINAEIQFFHTDNSYPFYQIFDREIIKRFNERNKKTIKKKN